MIPMAQHILPVLHAHPLKKALGPESFMRVLKVCETEPYVSLLISPCMHVLIVSIGCESDAAMIPPQIEPPSFELTSAQPCS